MYSLQLVDKRTTLEREESDAKVLTTAKIPAKRRRMSFLVVEAIVKPIAMKRW